MEPQPSTSKDFPLNSELNKLDTDMRRPKSPHAQFIALFSELVVPEDALVIFDELVASTDFIEQQKCIARFQEFMQDPGIEEEDVTLMWNLIVVIYMACPPRHELQKTIERKFLKNINRNVLREYFSENIQKHMKSVPEKNSYLLIYNYIRSLNTITELKPASDAVQKNINCLFQFVFSFIRELIDIVYERKVKDRPLQSADWLVYIDDASKFLLYLVTKDTENAITDEEKLKLLPYCYDTLIYPEVYFNIKRSCGYIVVKLLNNLPEKYRVGCVFKDYPYLDLLQVDKKPGQFLEKLGIKKVTDLKVLEVFKVCVFSAILNISESYDMLLANQINGASIVAFMFNEYNVIAKGGYNKTEFVKALLRGILTLCELLFQIKDAPLYISRCLDLMIIYSDIKDKFINQLVKQILFQLIVSGREKPPYMHIIFSWVSALPVISIRYLALTTLCDVGGTTFIIKIYCNLSERLLEDVVNCSNPQMVISCIETLMQKHHYQTSFQNWMSFWVYKILHSLKTEANLSFAKYYQTLFVSAFKINPLTIVALCQRNYFQSDIELCTFLQCIQHIKTENLHEHPLYKDNLGPIMVKFKCTNTIDTLITYRNDEVRIRILSFLTNCDKNKKIFERWELIMLEKFYYFNINTPCPGTRQEFINILKHIFVRLRESFAAAKEIHEEGSEEFKSLIANYRQFRHGIMTDTLLAGLNRDCNHIRRSACLDLINHVCDMKDKEQFLDAINTKDVSNLKFILQYDTYDQNKIWAVRILMMFPYQRLGLDNKQVLLKYIEDGFLLSRNLTPTLSITAALLLKIAVRVPDCSKIVIEKFQELKITDVSELHDNKSTVLLVLNYLLEQLKLCYEVAKDSLQEASSSHPIHGYLLCIRYLLQSEKLSERAKEESWKQFFENIIKWSLSLGKVISIIIYNQSPEGFLPEDDYVSPTDETAKAQMMTVFGWRASREISLLFGEIADEAPIITESNSVGLINEGHLLEIGDYFFDLLVNTKHRGAFEQASVGFAKLCERLWKSPQPSLFSLPESWISRTLSTLQGKSDDTAEACATRRSAGIPFMIQSILITEPAIANPLFCSTMESLLTISGDSSKLEEQIIHSLNILRALFKHTKLQKIVHPYCSRGMKIAIEGFRSKVWGIRNSSTLLFSTLMIRIFGVQITQDKENSPFSYHNKMAAKIFLANYCDLYVFMFETLLKTHKDRNSPVLYPVLLLFNQLFCFNEASEPLRRKQLMQFVDTCLHNPSYRIRNIAAKVFIQLKEHQKLPQYVVGCFIRLSNPTISDSYCHGTLLQLQYLLDAAISFKIKMNVSKIIDGTGWILICCPIYISHFTASAYIDILMRLIIKYDLKFKNCQIFNLITNMLQWHIDLDNDTILNSVGSKKFRTLLFQLKLYLSIHANNCSTCDNKWNNMYSNYDIFEKDLKNHQFLQTVCLRYMNYIKLLSSDYDRYIEYEEVQTLYMQPLIQLLVLIDGDSKSSIYGILYNTLTKFIIKRGAKTTCELIKSCFYEMVGFYDYSVFMKSRNYNNSNELLLKHILNCCEVSEDRLAFQAITWLDKFILHLPDVEIRCLDLTPMFDLLYKLSLATNDVLYRYGVSKFLLHNRKLFFRRDWWLNSKNLNTVWITAFTLFEDDDEGIRKVMSDLVSVDMRRFSHYFYVPQVRVHVPEYARRCLMHELISMMPVQCSLSFLLALTLRSTEIQTSNPDTTSVVFEDVGDLNNNIELFPLAKEAIKVLSKVFIDIKGGLQTDGNSTICITNKTLLTTIILLVKFYRNEVPFITSTMNDSMCCITMSILAFLGTVATTDEKFVERFKYTLFNSYNSEQTAKLSVAEKLRIRVLFSNIFKNALK